MNRNVPVSHASLRELPSFPSPSFPWVFWISLVNLKRGISLVILVFSLSFPRILWVRQGQKILGNFEVFLDKNQKPRKRRTGLSTLKTNF